MVVEIGENRSLGYDARQYEEITDDLRDIIKRVKWMDRDYFFLRRKRDGKIELHHRGQPDYTFCLFIPYDELDDRTLKLIWDTRAENAKKLFQEMDAHNNKLDQANKDYMDDYVKWVGTETYKYVNTHYSRDTLDDGAFKTRFV